MRKRIVVLTVLAAGLATTLLGVPLAVAIANYYLANEGAELERVADSAVLAVAPYSARHEMPNRLPVGGPGTEVGLYSPTGQRVLGSGPDRLDSVVFGIKPDQVVSADTADDIITAVAIGNQGSVTGIVRAAESRSELYTRIGLTWLAMVVLGALALVATWLVARRQALRLARPLEDLSGVAHQLGNGDFTVHPARSGIPEIDSVGMSLETTAQRLDELVARERAFSADASHQLRTPLAGLRLQLEMALEGDDAELRKVIVAALGTTDRLERTIDDLLALARATRAGRDVTSLDEVIGDLVEEWRTRLATRERRLRVMVHPGMGDTAAPGAVLRQILGILLDNAFHHGAGTVTVTARDAVGALAVDVSDEGAGPAAGGNVFAHREPDAGGHGIGLPLARRLAEAEGGRLGLTTPSPPTFTVLLPVAVSDSGLNG
ncbi:HAMP domain-containing sensor histidine kinase [Saccharomonospora sp. NPDC046836]|uniref:sensor histidine kinase n=1 Tax=Saccharomonospora sp. NPDC046836 TaxID=3156921 RepID=UPI0033CD9B0B